jgi:2-polyprenyl-3-methyl-5-hydroxy-6-metoxy-1,4-benzoquinol methylase
MELPADVSALIDRIGRKNGLQRSSTARATEALDPQELRDFALYLAHCRDEGNDLDLLADSYDFVVRELFREQVYFRKHGRYRHARAADVAASVYESAPYMLRYMHGLALTTFLWPNHAALRRCFRDALPTEPRGAYLEVGPGHGFYFLCALRTGLFERCEGIDISETSVALTERLLGSGRFGAFVRYRIRRASLFDLAADERFDWITMGEVLEHVDDPEALLMRAGAALAQRGRLFVTTCANAPAPDHVYLFETVDDISALARRAGLCEVGRLALPLAGKTIAECEAERLPINVALVLAHG